MDQIETMKHENSELKARLRQETALRMKLEQHVHLLEQLVHRDPDSGLRTPQYLHSRVKEEVERAVRFPSSMCLVTLGAPSGSPDTVGSLGQRLCEELRSTDHVFKLDGASLALLLIETPSDGAQIVVNRLAADLEHFIQGYGCTVTCFPVEANLAEDFLDLALRRHNDLMSQVKSELVPA